MLRCCCGCGCSCGRLMCGCRAAAKRDRRWSCVCGWRLDRSLHKIGVSRCRLLTSLRRRMRSAWRGRWASGAAQCPGTRDRRMSSWRAIAMGAEGGARIDMAWWSSSSHLACGSCEAYISIELPRPALPYWRVGLTVLSSRGPSCWVRRFACHKLCYS